MRIHCPYCFEPTELDHSVADSVVTCAACRSVFDPRKKETLPGVAAGAPSPAPELLPGICAGDGFAGYTLERKLGRGGMGIVFAATQLSLGRKVAIKILAPDLLKDPEFVKRFDREARVLASLNHPHIVQVIDKGIERGHVFLVMEHVDGVSLRDVMNEKKMPPADALKLIPQLCDALEYAHARGVVHRDIKPENILLGRDGVAKIADFGLARIVGEGSSGRITRSNVIMGSLDYMAPEQRERTRDADHRSDIYALGVVFYEMLTGELPLGRFEPPSKKVKLEIDVDEVVLKVLSKDPELRYQRASDVGDEIRRLAAAGAGGAGGPGGGPIRAETIRDALDRAAQAPFRKRLAQVLCFAVLALYLGVVGELWGYARHTGHPEIGIPMITASVLILSLTAILAVRLRVLDRVAWRPEWSPRVSPRSGRVHGPRVTGYFIAAAVLTMIFLPRPIDVALVAAMVPVYLAIRSRSPRLFSGLPEVEPISPYAPGGLGVPEGGAAEGALASVAGQLRTAGAEAGVAVRQAVAAVVGPGGRGRETAAPPDRAALAPDATPPAPAEPPRPRLSILALLGFLGAAGLFALGTAGSGFVYWVSADDWAIVDQMIDSTDRRLVQELLLADPAAVHGALLAGSIVAIAAGVLVFNFNGATLFSIGRRTGVRGGGFAFFGLVLSGLFGIETAAMMNEVLVPAARWREIDALQDVVNIVWYQDHSLELRGFYKMRWPTRVTRLGVVSTLARRGPAGVPALAEIAKLDGSRGVRYAATWQLAEAARIGEPEHREAARLALAPRLQDEVPAIRETAKQALAGWHVR